MASCKSNVISIANKIKDGSIDLTKEYLLEVIELNREKHYFGIDDDENEKNAQEAKDYVESIL